MYIIYKHTNKINNKSYIGQTCQEENRRWRNGNGYKDSPKFYAAIKKYGWENFTHEILEANIEDIQTANEREIYWIAYYDTYDNDDRGYNLTPGGSNYMEKLWQNPEYRERMKKSFSEARKRSWSNEKFANQQLEELKQGLQKAWNDRDWREKRIQNLIGEKNPNSKTVVNIETGIEFSTIKEAAEWAGVHSVSGIGQCCRGKQNTSGHHPDTNIPLHWKFKDSPLSNEEVLNNTISRLKRQVHCINSDMNFESLSEAARWCGLKDNGNSIKACCNQRQKTAGVHPDTKERLLWEWSK